MLFARYEKFRPVLKNSNERKNLNHNMSNNVYKYSFFPRTIVTWNNLPMNTSVNALDKIKAVALPVIKTLL